MSDDRRSESNQGLPSRFNRRVFLRYLYLTGSVALALEAAGCSGQGGTATGLLPSGGGDPAALAPIVGPAAPSDPANLIDGGISVRQLVLASQGGTISLPDGARLEIPGGALSDDTEIRITMRSQQSTASANLLYAFEPTGLQFNQPVRLVVPEPNMLEGQFLFVFSSSPSNTVFDVGSELTNWEEPLIAEDGAVLLQHFTFVWFIVAVDASSYLVTDIPGKYLQTGDLLFTLVGGDGFAGGNWQPGHVGMLLGSVVDDAGPSPFRPDSVVEADGTAVIRSTLEPDPSAGDDELKKGFKTAHGHIYLGPRRALIPKSAFGLDSETLLGFSLPQPSFVDAFLPHRLPDLNEEEKKTVQQFLLAQVGKGYSLIGETPIGGQGPAGFQIMAGDVKVIGDDTYSCVGLTVETLRRVNRHTLTLMQSAFVALPIEQYHGTLPVDEITMLAGETLEMPVYGVTLANDVAFIDCKLRGTYSRHEPYTISLESPTGALARATLEVANPDPKSYLFQFEAKAGDVSEEFHTVTLVMRCRRKACLGEASGFIFDVIRRIIKVKVKPGGEYEVVFHIPASTTPQYNLYGGVSLNASGSLAFRTQLRDDSQLFDEKVMLRKDGELQEVDSFPPSVRGLEPGYLFLNDDGEMVYSLDPGTASTRTRFRQPGAPPADLPLPDVHEPLGLLPRDAEGKTIFFVRLFPTPGTDDVYALDVHAVDPVPAPLRVRDLSGETFEWVKRFDVNDNALALITGTSGENVFDGTRVTLIEYQYPTTAEPIRVSVLYPLAKEVGIGASINNRGDYVFYGFAGDIVIRRKDRPEMRIPITEFVHDFKKLVMNEDGDVFLYYQGLAELWRFPEDESAPVRLNEFFPGSGNIVDYDVSGPRVAVAMDTSIFMLERRTQPDPAS